MDAVTADDRRHLARTAAAMYGGAAAVGLLESLLPGGTPFSLLPALGALAVTLLILGAGPRVAPAALALLGPLGVVLIASTIATTDGHTDAAVLYMWPVLWMAHFYGRRGTVLVVGCIAVAHAVALLAMPAERGNLDRWVDVVVSVGIVAAVTLVLTERSRRLVERLAGEARRDALTGLLNRRGFEERVELELRRSARDGEPLGAVAFDLDHFKAINDEHGHEVGDRVLVWVAGIIAAQARETDVVGRLGGEEFTVVLPRAGAAAARAFAERVRLAVRSAGDGAHRPAGVPASLLVTISAGVAAGARLPDAAILLAGADVALYEAKRAGRDRTVVRDGLGGDATRMASGVPDASLR